ncbi:MAG: hypothetical protein QM579_00850 [Desulfovibrio sp.]|uniref:hypothetical protein n=1 Tax=Desulfovibrio sp. TaxID=885 RepID=UPI0039E44798
MFIRETLICSVWLRCFTFFETVEDVRVHSRFKKRSRLPSEITASFSEGSLISTSLGSALTERCAFTGAAAHSQRDSGCALFFWFLQKTMRCDAEFWNFGLVSVCQLVVFCSIYIETILYHHEIGLQPFCGHSAGQV